MSETPERIWACMDGPMVGLFVSGGYNAGWPEYVRADLFDAVKADRDALEARVKALTETLKPFSYCIFDDNGDVTILTANLKTQDWLEARAALQENTDDR